MKSFCANCSEMVGRLSSWLAVHRSCCIEQTMSAGSFTWVKKSIWIEPPFGGCVSAIAGVDWRPLCTMHPAPAGARQGAAHHTGCGLDGGVGITHQSGRDAHGLRSGVLHLNECGDGIHTQVFGQGGIACEGGEGSNGGGRAGDAERIGETFLRAIFR